MAQIIKMNEGIQREDVVKKTSPVIKISVLVFLLITAGCGCAFVSGTKSVALFGIGAISALITVVLFMLWMANVGNNIKQKEIVSAGKKGENTTGYLLSKLPNNYYVIQNVMVTLDGKSSEIDNVVVGETGVFVVETKNHNGSISGSYDQKDWVQHKVGRGGTPYSKTFYSPVKQVGTHIYRLSGLLKKNHIRTYINGAVLFSNPEATVRVSGTSNGTPVFSLSEGGVAGLLNYITSGTEKLTPEEVNRIVSIVVH